MSGTHHPPAADQHHDEDEEEDHDDSHVPMTMMTHQLAAHFHPEGTNDFTCHFEPPLLPEPHHTSHKPWWSDPMADTHARSPCQTPLMPDSSHARLPCQIHVHARSMPDCHARSMSMPDPFSYQTPSQATRLMPHLVSTSPSPHLLRSLIVDG
jgi:hypothetical protein